MAEGGGVELEYFYATSIRNLVQTLRSSVLSASVPCTTSTTQAPIKHLLGQKCATRSNATTKELIYEGWTHVYQRFINEKISNMSGKAQAGLGKERKMAGCYI